MMLRSASQFLTFQILVPTNPSHFSICCSSILKEKSCSVLFNRNSWNLLDLPSGHSSWTTSTTVSPPLTCGLDLHTRLHDHCLCQLHLQYFNVGFPNLKNMEWFDQKGPVLKISSTQYKHGWDRPATAGQNCHLWISAIVQQIGAEF